MTTSGRGAWRQRARARARADGHRRLSSAREPVDDAGAARPAGAGRGVRRPALPRHLHRRRAAPDFWRGSVAFRRALPMRPRIPLWVKLTPASSMLIGLAIAWHDYIRRPTPRPLRRAVPARLPLPAQQMVFRRALRRPLRPPGAVARPVVLEARRRRHDRPLRPARRGLCGRRRQPLTARLQSGYLYTYALVMLLGLIGAATWAIWWARDRASRCSAILLAVPLSPAALCLFAQARRRALDRAGRDAGRPRARHLAVGAYDPGGAAMAVRREARRSAAASAGRSASTASP